MAKKKEEKRGKKGKIGKKQIIIFAGVGVIVLAVVLILLLTGGIVNKDITEATFSYLDYSVVNETFLKANCPVINIGRCDTIGGEFGESCWTREVDLFFNIKVLSYRGIHCDVTDGAKNLGEYRFEKKESSLYLPVKVDIRKFSSLDICCNSDEGGEVCFQDIEIDSVC